MSIEAEGEGRVLMARLRELGAARQMVLHRAGELDSRVGAIAAELTEEYGMPKSEIARVLGVSQPHVTSLIRRAAGVARPPEASDTVPVLSYLEALGYLADTKRELRRVVAGFVEFDVLIQSRLDPSRFLEGWELRVPHMLWQTDEGRWLGVDDVNVGYGGTGPRTAYEALVTARIKEKYADSAFRHRFFNFDFAKGTYNTSDHSPYALALPVLRGGAYVARLTREDLPGTYEAERAVARPDPNLDPNDGRTAYERWVDLLEEKDLPPWLSGPRVARVFADTEAARQQGFTRYGSDEALRGNDVYEVVVEQGEVQIWAPIYPPLDPTQMLSDEAYRALAVADLYPDDLARLDERSSLVRYLQSVVRRRRPAFFDISKSGQERLNHVPSGGA